MQLPLFNSVQRRSTPATRFHVATTRATLIAASDTAWIDAYEAVATSLQKQGPDSAVDFPTELPPDTPAEEARRAALEAILVAFSIVQGSHHVSARMPFNEDGLLGEVGGVLYDVRHAIVHSGYYRLP